MRRLGQILAVLGLVVGGIASLALFLPVHFTGLAWLVAVGMVKLTFVSSLGLIGAGAVLQRLANRAQPKQLPK